MTYEEWLEKNGYEELLSGSPASIVCRKDGMPIWEDKEGHKFIGLCNKKLFEAGVEEATKEMQNEIKKLREQSFSDVRLYTQIIELAVKESVMIDKQKYKEYLYDKAKYLLNNR